MNFEEITNRVKSYYCRANDEEIDDVMKLVGIKPKKKVGFKSTLIKQCVPKEIYITDELDVIEQMDMMIKRLNKLSKKNNSLMMRLESQDCIMNTWFGKSIDKVYSLKEVYEFIISDYQQPIIKISSREVDFDSIDKIIRSRTKKNDEIGMITYKFKKQLKEISQLKTSSNPKFNFYEEKYDQWLDQTFYRDSITEILLKNLLTNNFSKYNLRFIDRFVIGVCSYYDFISWSFFCMIEYKGFVYQFVIDVDKNHSVDETFINPHQDNIIKQYYLKVFGINFLQITSIRGLFDQIETFIQKLIKSKYYLSLNTTQPVKKYFKNDDILKELKIFHENYSFNGSIGKSLNNQKN